MIPTTPSSDSVDVGTTTSQNWAFTGRIRLISPRLNSGDVSRAAINLSIGTHTQRMSKNISISDDVYRRLKREKGDRSFSEVIAEKLDGGGQIADVTGQGVFDAETPDKVADEIERLSEGTMDRVTDEDL